MKIIFTKPYSITVVIFLAMTIVACDQMENVASGVGTGVKGVANKITGSDGPDTKQDNDGAEKSESQPSEVAKQEAEEPENVQPTKVRLDAFQHFNCTGNWGNRDGGLGLKAGSGSGSCRAQFPGHSGNYRVTLMAQLEFDGAPKFKITIDGKTIAAGEYPMSKGKLICDCPNWRVNCPDRVIPIDAGMHTINKGSTIEFYGEEVYPCGSDSHGAYAKWREMVFTPG